MIEDQEFRWDVVTVVAAILILIFAFGYYLPNWISDTKQQSYDQGFRDGKSGDDATFSDGFQKGRLYEREGWHQYYSLYWYYDTNIRLENETCTKSVDKRYNTQWISCGNYTEWNYSNWRGLLNTTII